MTFLSKKRLTFTINTIENKTKLKILDSNNTRKTLLKGTFLLFKNVYEDSNIVYPILSIKKINDTSNIVETFIVEDNPLLIGSLDNEKIVNIKMVSNKSSLKTTKKVLTQSNIM